MRKLDYPRLYRWSASHPRLIRVLMGLRVPAVILVVLSFAAYLGFSAYLGSVPRAVIAAVVSGVPFVLVSVLRRILGERRPYEVYDFGEFGIEKPRGKGGDSFPSRHSFSSFMIGTLMLPDVPVLGALVLLLAVFISTLRVLVGIHFLKDVTVGAIIGVLTGAIGAVCLHFFA